MLFLFDDSTVTTDDSKYYCVMRSDGTELKAIYVLFRVMFGKSRERDHSSFLETIADKKPEALRNSFCKYQSFVI